MGQLRGGIRSHPPPVTNPNGTTGCQRTNSSVTGVFAPKIDYIPHHEGFQYYVSTANLTHMRPSSIAMIGHDDGRCASSV